MTAIYIGDHCYRQNLTSEFLVFGNERFITCDSLGIKREGSPGNAQFADSVGNQQAFPH